MNLIDSVVEYAPIVITAASAVAATTPTPRQGSLLWWVYRTVDFLALNVGKAKDQGEPPCR
ncbi:MAG: hypothetical protein HQL99_13265 [Magnetococcales bacterium]|nr:hypothetical protein [Magnetococcales bacterium]